MNIEIEIRNNVIPDILRIINEYCIDKTYNDILIEDLKFRHNTYNDFLCFVCESYSELYFKLYNHYH